MIDSRGKVKTITYDLLSVEHATLKCYNTDTDKLQSTTEIRFKM